MSSVSVATATTGSLAAVDQVPIVFIAESAAIADEARRLHNAPIVPLIAIVVTEVVVTEIDPGEHLMGVVATAAARVSVLTVHLAQAHPIPGRGAVDLTAAVLAVRTSSEVARIVVLLPLAPVVVVLDAVALDAVALVVVALVVVALVVVALVVVVLDRGAIGDFSVVVGRVDGSVVVRRG